MKIEELGFTREEILTKLVNQLEEDFLHVRVTDENGETDFQSSPMKQEIQNVVKKRINEAIEKLASEKIAPMVDKFLSDAVFKETNTWGESKKEPYTFLEYLANRAENYLTEPVNYEGKTKKESGGYSWTAGQSRIAHMVSSYLQYSIETTMKDAVLKIHQSIAIGLEQTIKIKMGELAEKLKVSVDVKR